MKKWYKLFTVLSIGIVFLSYLTNFKQATSYFQTKQIESSHTDININTSEPIAYIYLPFSHTITNGYSIVRSGLIYRDDYNMFELQTKSAPTSNPSLCPTIQQGGNKYCLSSSLNDSDYHDGTLPRNHLRSSIDINMTGSVKSASLGVVTYVEACAGNGSGVVHVRMPDNTQEDHRDNIYIEYRHLATISVTVNQILNIGDNIGIAGGCDNGNPNAFGVHLHISAFTNYLYDNIEIRFLDRQARMIHPDGVPIAKRGTLTGNFRYVADNHSDWNNANYWPPQIQYRTPVRFLQGTKLYAHILDETPPYDVQTSVDFTIDPLKIINEDSKLGHIIQAPLNWGTTYPYVINQNIWWYVLTEDGTKGWVEQNNLRTCLSNTYCDVPHYNVFVQMINKLHQAGISAGCLKANFNLFCPDDFMTREQMAAFVKRAANFETNLTCEPFPDVQQGHPFYEDITTLKCLNVIDGYTDGYFKPTEFLTRGQLAKFVSEARQIKIWQLSKQRYGTGSFDRDCYSWDPNNWFVDVPDNYKFHSNILCLFNRQIIEGDMEGGSRYFYPERYVTRGEAAKYIANVNSLLYLGYPNLYSDSLILKQIVQQIQGYAQNGVVKSSVPLSYSPNFNYEQGVYWTASRGHGVGLYIPHTFTITTFTTLNGLPHNIVNAIDINENTGEIWAGTNLGVSKFDGTLWTIYEDANKKVNDITISPSGMVWIAENNALLRFDGVTWVEYTNQNGLPYNKFKTIFATDDVLWGVTENGEFGYFDGTNWTSIVGLPHGNIDDIVVVNDCVFLSHNQGVLEFCNGVFNQLKPNSNLFNINALENDEGYLWVILENGSMAVYDTQSAEWVIPLAYISDNFVKSISYDQLVEIYSQLNNVNILNISLNNKNLDKPGLPNKNLLGNYDISIIDYAEIPISIPNEMYIELTFSLPVNIEGGTAEVYVYNNLTSQWEKLNTLAQNENFVTVKLDGFAQYSIFGDVKRYDSYFPIITKD